MTTPDERDLFAEHADREVLRSQVARARRWIDESSRVTIGSFKIPSLRFEIEPSKDDETQLTARVHMGGLVSIDKPGEHIDLTWSETIGRGDWLDVIPGRRGEEVRRVVMNALAHEVDEWLRIDGEHVRDPHPESMPLSALAAWNVGPEDSE